MANVRVYYGVYDGQVCAVNDPEKRGRIQCIIPEVTGDYPSAWCEPCVPVAYDDGGDFYLPKLKEYVWIMFEQGDPNKPVYFGSWWATNRTPLANDYEDKKLNERIISFFSSFIKMFKNEKKIEIGVTKNDPEIVIEEGKVNLKGFEGGKVDDVQVNDVSVVQNKVAKVKVPTKVSELQEDTNAKIMTSAERNKLSGVEEGANVNRVDDVEIYGESVLENKIAKVDPNGVIQKTDPLYQILLEKGLINSSFSVDLLNHGEWVDSETKVDNFPVYKSNASHNRDNAWDTAKITFKGYSTFRIFIRSYAESTYDYCLVSTLNNDYLATRTSTSAMRSAYSNTEYTKAYTRGKQSATNYEEVVFDNLNADEEYYFYVIYQKDNSTNSNDDRGYFYIPMNQSSGKLNVPFNQNDVLNLLFDNLLIDLIYPVGKYVWTSDENWNPNIVIGGTWEKLDEGTTLVSAGETYTISSGTAKDGGDATHTLTVNEMPSHRHKAALPNYHTQKTVPVGTYTISDTQNTNAYTEYTGGGQPHNNMPPYKNAYCWHRIA